MQITSQDLHQLIAAKLHQAGLNDQHAQIMADIMLFAEMRGIHSHGSVRTEYYAERISKGGITVNPQFRLEKTGPCSAIFHGDNGSGMVAAKDAMHAAIDMAKENGVAVVGVKKMSHSGAISYYTRMAAKEGLFGFSVCQSDPMVVPFGGAEMYYGTNPISFAVQAHDKRLMTFDMATTVQAWGKVLDKRSRHESIPSDWAVDEKGEPTTDPFAVKALVPIAGPKGYGLMAMVDILSGVLLNLPFGRHVSSMYADLSQGRDLGQLHIVLNPSFFGDAEIFKQSITTIMQELNAIKPAVGFTRVLYPGENSDLEEQRTQREGLEIVDDIYAYLKSDKLYIHSYDHKNPFAE